MRSFQPHRPSDDHPHEHVVAYDIETVVDDEPADGSFPPWPRHRPVAAAFLAAHWRSEGYRFDLTTLTCASGEEAAFYAAVDARLPKGLTGITYNGRGFDLPVLRLQAMAAGRFDLEGLSNQAHASRYGREHLDLADQLCGYGSTRRVPLAEICATLDIPVKLSVDGSEVGALWRAGEIEAIKRYVEEDVIATYILALHWLAFRASDERRIAVPLADLVGWIERSPALAHLRPFTTCRPAMRARSRALLHRVNQAGMDAERRLERERDDRAFSNERPIF